MKTDAMAMETGKAKEVSEVTFNPTLYPLEKWYSNTIKVYQPDSLLPSPAKQKMEKRQQEMARLSAEPGLDHPCTQEDNRENKIKGAGILNSSAGGIKPSGGIKLSGSIKLSDIVFDAKIYPRNRPSRSLIEEYADALACGAKFPPIILEKSTYRLLDGYHRWRAYRKYQEKYHTLTQEARDNDSLAEPPGEINCEFHEIPEGIEPKLYALSLSSRNGTRPTPREKEKAAQEQYKAHPGASFKTIAEYAGVSVTSVRNYLKPLAAEFEEAKQIVIMRLDALGWTQDEISEKLKEFFPDAKGVSQQSIAQLLPGNEKHRFLVKEDLARGLSAQMTAKRKNLPETLVQHIALADLPDNEKLDRLDIEIQARAVWSFSRRHKLFDNTPPANTAHDRIPGELAAHVLYFFTKPGDMVLDPMAGSGTTLDVCLAMGRKCYSYDIDNKYHRSDIIKHDLAKAGWPERIKKASLIFWDPPCYEAPYYEEIENRHEGEGKRCADGSDGSIGKLSREEYLAFFAGRLSEASALVKKGTRLAFLMSDRDDGETQGKGSSGETQGEGRDGETQTEGRKGIFLWDYANVISRAGWRLVRHIQVHLSTQQIHSGTAFKLNKSGLLARLERYLLVAEI